MPGHDANPELTLSGREKGRDIERKKKKEIKISGQFSRVGLKLETKLNDSNQVISFTHGSLQIEMHSFMQN